MSDRNDIERSFAACGGGVKKAAAVLAAAFFCYFASESLLRQAAAGKMHANGLSIDTVVSKLPEGIRDSVQRKIEIAKLRRQLKRVKTPEERIFTLLALGNASSEEDLELAYAEILDEFPEHPASAQAYTHFLLAPKTAKRSVSLKCYRKYISKVPDTDRIQLWTTAYSKMIEKNFPPERILEFFTPIIENPPPFKDYKALYLEIAELAFQNQRKELSVKCKTLSSKCDDLPSVDFVLSERARKKKARLKAEKRRKASAKGKK